MELEIDIDSLTPCLKDVSTGELVQTTFAPVRRSELAGLKKQGWLFQWKANDLKDSEIYKLLVLGNTQIQGLFALEIEAKSNAVHAVLAESAPHNRGQQKEYEGVGGHLFAIAAQRSVELGFGGFLFLDAKNMDLVNHYSVALGAVLLGMPHPYRMIVDEQAAQSLLNKYTLDKEAH